MASTPKFAALVFCLLISAAHGGKHRSPTPCQQLSFYFHNIIYNGQNYNNATSVIVGYPPWGNQTTLATQFHFGDLVVFDDPITADNNLHSPPVGRARGMYFYDQQNIYGAWLGFSITFNSTEHVGTLTFAGADPTTIKTRDISVIGGTGDFFMARGVATLTSDAVEAQVYFRLRVDVRLYECW